MGIPKARANPKSAIFKSPNVTKIDTIFVNQKILGLKVSVNNSPGMAEIDAIYKLEHEEFDLVTGDVGRVEFKVFFQIIVGKFKNQMKLFLAWAVNDIHEAESKQKDYLTMLGWG